MVLGAFLSGRLAGKLSASATVRLGYVIMLTASAINVIVALVLPEPRVPWSVLPIGLHAIGIGVNFPTLTLLLLEPFPAPSWRGVECAGVRVPRAELDSRGRDLSARLRQCAWARADSRNGDSARLSRVALLSRDRDAGGPRSRDRDLKASPATVGSAGALQIVRRMTSAKRHRRLLSRIAVLALMSAFASGCATLRTDLPKPVSTAPPPVNDTPSTRYVQSEASAHGTDSDSAR